MREDIRERLSELAREEYDSAGGHTPDVQKLYGRPGRFIIERRRVSHISGGRIQDPISLRVHPIRISFPEHSHDFIELMYVYSGSITHRVKGQPITVGEGDVIIFGKEARHSVDAATEGDIGINIVISAELYERLLSQIRRGSSLSTAGLESVLDRGEDRYLCIDAHTDPNVRGLIENIIFSGLMREEDGYVMQESLSLLLCYLLGCDRNKNSAASKERRLIDYLCSSYSSATLGEAAQILGFSEAYLSRWCRQRLGFSFKELLMGERFTAACELLTSTDMPIGSIITAVGYENSSYFHKEFKERLGTTPGEYRRSTKR